MKRDFAEALLGALCLFAIRGVRQGLGKVSRLGV